MEVYLKISITRYISDDPQPGIVECELVDANAQRWRFVDKTAIFSSETLTSQTDYPQPGVIAGELVSRGQNEAGREILVIDTVRPWGVESVDGTSEFEVFADAIISPSE